MRFYPSEYLLQFMCGKSIVIRQAYWIEPKLGFAIASFQMNVRRFIAFMGIKVESIAAFSQYGRHMRSYFLPSFG